MVAPVWCVATCARCTYAGAPCVRLWRACWCVCVDPTMRGQVGLCMRSCGAFGAQFACICTMLLTSCSCRRRCARDSPPFAWCARAVVVCRRAGATDKQGRPASRGEGRPCGAGCHLCVCWRLHVSAHGSTLEGGSRGHAAVRGSCVGGVSLHARRMRHGAED